MKELMRILIALALLWGGCVAAIEFGHDRETVVPPPDAVAEGFTREVLTKRYPRARDYLLDPDSVSDGELQALRERIQSRARIVSVVEAKTIDRDEKRAFATVRVSSSFGEETVRYRLVFEKEWKIAGVSSRAESRDPLRLYD